MILQVGSADDPYIAIDLGSPTLRRIKLGIPSAQSDYPIQSVQAWGTTVPIPMGTAPAADSVWLFKRGAGFDDQPVHVSDFPAKLILSPDGRELLEVDPIGRDMKYSNLLLVPTDGSKPRRLGRILTSGSPKNSDMILTPTVWLPTGGWLALPTCACDAGASDWYTISQQGRVTRSTWLGTPVDGQPGISRDGRYLSFFAQDAKDCPTAQDPMKLCPVGRSRILLADTVTHRIRVLATSVNDLDYRTTAISPDGSLVAVPVGGSHAVEILDSKTGHVLASVSSRRDALSAVAFVDDSTLLLAGASDANESDALFVARIDFGRVRLTQLARDIVPVTGWVR